MGKNKKKETKKPEQLGNGMFLYDMKYTDKPPIIPLLARGLIVFLLVFGSVGGFLSAFHLEYNIMAFAGVILLMSLFFSVIYIKPVARNLGYLLFFVLFVAWAVRYRNYINSGFYALINEMILTIADYFQQKGVNEYSEYVTNRYVTVTMMACFIGIVDALLMNISVIRKIKLFHLVSMSILVYFLPVYLEEEPGLGYVLCIMAGLGCAVIAKAGNPSKAFLKRKRFREKRKAVPVHISYQQSPEIWMQTIGYMVAMAAIGILCVNLLVPQSTFHQRVSASSVKTTMDAYVQDIWQFGFESIFEKDATGGMGKGQLGRAASVRPDYETDLVIKFAPYSMNTLYLKAYTGTVYGDNQWESETDFLQLAADEKPEEAKVKNEAMYEEAILLDELSKEADNSLAKGKISIKNVDADTEFLYYPYYTLLEDYSHYAQWHQGIRVGKTVEYTYYPLVSEPDIQEKRQQPDRIYLDVPEKNKEVVADICKEMNLHGSQEEIIEQVVDYFEENIPYTVRPGAVPRNEDVINYFLTKSRKGYCAHFASSAVLIFRYMGIPARYVEGYAVGYGQVLEGAITEENYEDYYQGYSPLGETAVMEVEVSDASAHAWVEVFDENFGWIPIEVTPSSSEDIQEENNFWDFLRNIFQETEAPAPNEGGQDTQGNVKIDIDGKKIAIVAVAFFSILLLIYLLKIARRMYYVRTKDSRERVIVEYERLCDMLRRLDPQFNQCCSHREQLVWMQEKFYLEESATLALASPIEEISYSKEEIEQTILLEVRQQLLMLRKKMTGQLKLKDWWRILLGKK